MIGATWIFIRVLATTWTQQTKLIATGYIGQSLQGQSVSLASEGNTLAVGAPGDNGNIGTTWIFIRNLGLWTQQQQLIGAGNIGPSMQGTSVSLGASGFVVAIGGPTNNSNTGGVWIFLRDNTGFWTQDGTALVVSDSVGAPMIGISVSISKVSNTIAIGGPGDNGNVGATWIFTRDLGIWSQRGNKLVGSGSIGQPLQGTSVSLAAVGNTLAIGGPNSGIQLGAIWIFV